MDYFQGYNDYKSGGELPNPEQMNTAEKMEVAAFLKQSGKSVKEIAFYLGDSIKYVYDLLRKGREELVSELEAQTDVEAFFEELANLEFRRDILLQKAEKIRVAGDDEYTDPETGDKVKKKGSTRDFCELFRIIRDYDSRIIALKQDAGLIPVAGNKKINYNSISDRKPSSDERDDNSLVTMSKDELANMLLERLKNQRETLVPKEE